MPYWQLFYHLVWGTRGRNPWLVPEIEPLMHGFIRDRARAVGATVYALDGIEDHVHLVAAIPPKLAVARFIGQVKSTSSTLLNDSGQLGHTFAWQTEYGAFTVGKKQLPWVIAYVERQKEHHRAGTTRALLERF